MDRKVVELKAGWISQVDDGVPFNLGKSAPAPKAPRAGRKFLDQLLTVAEVADYLRVPKSTVYTWVCEKRIKVKKAGRLVRIEASELERFLSCA